MNHLLHTLEPYGFNSRRLRENDLLRICEYERIEVSTERVATSFFVRAYGKANIVIPDHFQGLRREFAIAHELAHTRHAGDVGLYFMGVEATKEEAEANAMACIALIPYHEMHEPSILDEYPLRFAREIRKERERLRFLFGV